MMNNKIVLLMVCFSMSACVLAKTTYICPEKIQLNNAQLVEDNVNKNWQSTTTDSPLWLTNVGIYDGPAKDNAALVPTGEKGKNSTWIFEGSYPQGKFIACEYGNGVVKLDKKIEDSAKNCSSIVKSPTNRAGVEAVIICGP